jgi:predicted glycoside hydrolase/deacetylase ChbG (UPF0249 family)
MSVHSQRRSRLIIITADDFGRDAACTAAIADSFADGSITATSIMANASHFDLACTLARSCGLMGKIGVHLCLDEGPALSPEMLRYADSNGQLCMRRSLKPFGPQLSHAVETELAAQIERVIAAGIRPTHLDSHRHIHTAFPIGRLVVKLARHYGIPYVRPARNLAGGGTPAARVYKWIFNRYLASRVKTADYFGDIVNFYHCGNESRPQAGLIECMIHLDESPRGLDGRRLLKNEGFKCFLEDFELIGHAETNNT